ncbi:uncharacterized protein [Physcomitrium patens]|uniref:uncharacterized protein isoform X3 n=1 Tax=Physcomitrium patens TaxID=3218 RepID=UPI000D1550A6|nr:calcium-activated potassium channel subunit alpha-1-like isoform X3 [Physcomitrium patens]|eukprot:XP_024367760.1 calcium-activated potassium channel subunit alpha-1-like isoform X3 [Physcomitrella patens]
MATLFALLNSRNRSKRIEASKPVLETYHESFLYGKVDLTVRVRGAIRSGWIGFIWHLLEFFLATASGVLYVYSTYKDYTKYNWASVAQNYISLFFAIDYALRVYSESARWCYVFSLRGLIDILSAVPVVYFIRSVETNGRFLRLLQFLRIVRIISLVNKIGVFGSTILQQVLVLITSTFGAVFLIAGLIHYVEYHGAPQSRQAECPEEGCINFWDAFYFVIVTISTVGYGDITPETALGRLVAILTIIGALVILPIQIGRITFLASRRPYGGSFDSKKILESRFLVITGSFTFQELQEYLAEFYNPTHCEDLEIYPLRVNILAPFSPSFELKQLLSLYNGLVEFIEGSPIRQSDLARVCAERASAIFLLAKNDAKDRGVEDAAQIVKALAIQRYCNDHVRIIVEVLEPATQASAVWDLTDNRGIEVICPIKFHYRMIARSCFVKGLYTLITNMFTSEIKMKTLPRNSFLSEYFSSFDNEVYPLIFPKACHGMLYEEVVEFIFENFNAVLFALDVNVIDPEKEQPARKVFLHPKGRVIIADDVGLLLCPDLGTVFDVSGFDDKKSKGKKWIPRKKRNFSSVQLQNYRTGPVVDEVEQSRATDPISYTAVDSESLESRMKTEIFSWYESDESRHGSSHGRKHGNDGSRQGTNRGSKHGNGGRHGTDRESKHAIEDSIEAGYGSKFSNGTRDVSRRHDSVSLSDSDSEDEGLYPRGVSLEKATDLLLAWPPIGPNQVQPHASVLERRQDVILENLQARTVGVVSLNAPHILVCCQNDWPQEMFYLVKELRKPDMPKPPIVILYPDRPSAIEWGKRGW